MGRTVNPTTMAQVRPLVAQGLNGAQIAKALGLKTRDGRWYAQQVRADAATNGHADDPTPAATTEDVPLDQLHLTGETQARVWLNREVIAEYAERMTAGVIFPPVTVFMDAEDQRFWIGDGYHRAHAAQQVGSTTITAEVRPGGQRAARLYAASANITNGLHRSNADKRKAVETLLGDEEWGRWSNVVIARHCGVSDEMVRLCRQSLPTVGSSDGQRTYLRDGQVQTMDTTNIGAGAHGTGARPDPGEPSTYQQAKARREARERAAFEAQLQEALAGLPKPFKDALALIQSHLRERLQTLPPDERRRAAGRLGVRFEAAVYSIALKLHGLDKVYREVFGEPDAPEPAPEPPTPLARVIETDGAEGATDPNASPVPDGCAWHQRFPAIIHPNPDDPEVRCPSCGRTLDAECCAGCSRVVLRTDSLLEDEDDDWAVPTISEREPMCVRCARARAEDRPDA